MLPYDIPPDAYMFVCDGKPWHVRRIDNALFSTANVRSTLLVPSDAPLGRCNFEMLSPDRTVGN